MIKSVKKQYSNNEFVSYELIYDNGNIMSVPLAEDNTDYQAIQEWIADGGTVIDNPPE
tara:strand:+ start:56 stop:229 length:174 start_codon:yes stop_codon:yes gene_type:complete